MLTTEELLEGTIIAVDKPRQWTSFQTVNKVKSTIRKMYGLKKFKIGHAGTLDPLATGLLLVCVGKATKQIEELQKGEKEYTGTMVLGATTASYDLEQPVDKTFPTEHLTEERIENARKALEGEIMQVPPMFSAIKIDGQRAYSYVREGGETEEVKPEPKKVTVKSFEVSNWRECPEPETVEKVEGRRHLYDNPQGVVPKGLPMVDFRVVCGKGTYIRSMARDFGMLLDSGALLYSLRRERIGEYRAEVNLDNIEEYLEQLRR